MPETQENCEFKFANTMCYLFDHLPTVLNALIIQEQ